MKKSFFYLYLSTADKERKKKQSPTQQASLLSHTACFEDDHDEDSDDAESEDDEQLEVDKVGTTENYLQQTSSCS